MAKGWRSFVVVVFVAVLLASAMGEAEATEPVEPRLLKDTEAVVKGNNAFALELYAKLKGQEGNLFFSPYSISTALAMTYAGARGNTAAERARVLHFDLTQERLHPAFARLVSDLSAKGKKGGYKLSVANALWGQKGYGFLKSFLDLVKTSYGGGLNKVDFEGATEAARQTINAWVEKETKDKIRDLIQPGILVRFTVLVLTNAIYFKGDWELKFKEERTKPAPFKLLDGKTVEVPLMRQTEEFGYMEGDDFQALELPYVGEDLSMVVLLPGEVGGLANLEKFLTQENLEKWLGRLRKQKVQVYFPKFKMTSKFMLASVLRAMGMGDAFSGSADFFGMTGKKELFISAVIHKAFVEVNEEGTEAAAAQQAKIKMITVNAAILADTFIRSPFRLDCVVPFDVLSFSKPVLTNSPACSRQRHGPLGFVA